MSGVNGPRRRWPAVLLGGFVVWQLGFIPAANLLPFLHPARPPEPAVPVEGEAGPGPEARLPAGEQVLGAIEGVLGHWSNLTGQLQGWSLYAPFVPTQATFIAVELCWDEATAGPGGGARRVRLRSAVEPDDPRHYFRPFCDFRLPAYEANLGLVMWAWDEDAVAREPGAWRRRITAAVRRQWKPMLAYLRWRSELFAREHPEAGPPTQVILLTRSYRIPPPETTWGIAEPVERPIARWRPGAEVPPDCLPLESYNPVTHGFDRITPDG